MGFITWKVKINLKSPSMDKGYGVEIFDAGFKVEFLLTLPEVKSAKGFLQCSTLDYSFLEFWTDKEDLILAAWEAIENKLKKDLPD